MAWPLGKISPSWRRSTMRFLNFEKRVVWSPSNDAGSLEAVPILHLVHQTGILCHFQSWIRSLQQIESFLSSDLLAFKHVHFCVYNFKLNTSGGFTHASSSFLSKGGLVNRLSQPTCTQWKIKDHFTLFRSGKNRLAWCRYGAKFSKFQQQLGDNKGSDVPNAHT